MRQFPLVSIITPSFNQGQYIEETILSVLNQDYPHIEYIVVDGGSTDQTLDILKKYSDRLTYTSEPDSGQSDAINKGWGKATGEIVAWLNSDDTYCPGAIQKIVRGFELHPEAGAVLGNCYATDSQGKIIRHFRMSDVNLSTLLSFNIIHQPTVFLRKSVIDTIGSLDTNLHGLMDHDLWIRTAFRFKFHRIDEFLACGRIHPHSKNATLSSEFGPEAIKILDRIFDDPETAIDLAPIRKKVYAGAHLHSAFWHCLGGENKKARTSLARAIRLHPRFLMNELALPVMIECFLGIPIIQPLQRIKHEWTRFSETIRQVIKRPSENGPLKQGSK